MKISSILRGLLAYPADEARASGAPWDAGWTDDPYGHPDISAMSERERADLPPTHMPARVATGDAASRLVRCA